MSFAINAGGTVSETLASLRKMTPADLGTDGLGADMRDVLVKHIERGAAELDGHQIYEVHAHGHSGQGEIVSLAVRVQLGNRPLDPPVPG
jgi:hypothetical protein